MLLVCTENDVTSAIWDLKHKKAYGEDKIQNEHLYYGGPAVVSCLMILFNTVITKSNVPQQWRRSLVVPIFKGGDKPKNSPDSYRPVCLVYVVLKVHGAFGFTMKIINNTPQFSSNS
jgi:hypothetical protein